MTVRNTIKRFQSDCNGASAAEFALVLPMLLVFILGTIDVGLYTWSINRAEKATQTGARWAVVTNMLPSGLADHSFAVTDGIPQGATVPASAFPGVTCTSTACTCKGSCTFSTDIDSAAFTALVNRMQDIRADIVPTDVTVNYDYSGLGFAGDPNGPDVAPFVTVELTGLEYQPITLALFGAALDLPDLRYSLTAEDSEGLVSN